MLFVEHVKKMLDGELSFLNGVNIDAGNWRRREFDNGRIITGEQADIIGDTHPECLCTLGNERSVDVRPANARGRRGAAYTTLHDLDALRNGLALYGYMDTMRAAADVICRYDALIDSDRVTPAERKVLRAQMAYLAYRLASPANWSIERGYNSGNLNMSVAHTLNQGLAACILADHPMAREWSANPVKFMNEWMNRIDSAGHWPESSGYARVSESKFIYYAIAAHRAGLHDFLNDPRFKRMVMYFERTLTPPDPQCVMTDSPANDPHHPRVTAPYGRGGNANSVGLGGIVAKATATIDPEYSRILQWSYARTYFSTMLGEPMAGYDQLLCDPTLPTQKPDWKSELLPSVGALFRSGVGALDENYLLMVTKNPTNPDGEIWPSEVGGLKIWFEHGQPLTRSFPAYPYEHYHGLLINRVMLATNWAPGQNAAAGYLNKETLQGFATLPRADYISETYEWTAPWTMFAAPPSGVPAFPHVNKVGVLPAAGQPPVTWQRQALYMRDADASGQNYLVLRDTVSGGQPTQWQFWTLSKQIQPVDGQSVPIPQAAGGLSVMTGQRFTAVGQFGINVDYYVASPLDTPRHTLRYSTHSETSGVVRAFSEEQDLLHLQMPGNGSYFVALFPHRPNVAAPTFSTLGNGTIIKVTGTFGTDYAFLSDTTRTVTVEGVTFSGTAISVQNRPTGRILSLAAPGGVRGKSYGLAAAMPVSLAVAADALTLHLPAGHPEGKVVLTAPDGWHLSPGSKGATVAKGKATEYTLTIPAGMETVALVR